MNRLNRKIEYALMALKVMADKRPGELTSAKEIVEKTGCPFDATARVLQQMTQKAILRSEQGAYGGYALVRDLQRFSVLELMEIIIGPLALARCLGIEDDCEIKDRCNILGPITALNRRVSEFYSQVSVGELFKFRHRPEVCADEVTT